MSPYTPPPETVTWTFDKPVTVGAASYSTLTLRAPTGGDILKASAAGDSGYAMTLRMIAEISAESWSFEAVLAVPAWQLDQMSRYFDLFNGAPLPGPLAPPVVSSAGSASLAA